MSALVGSAKKRNEKVKKKTSDAQSEEQLQPEKSTKLLQKLKEVDKVMQKKSSILSGNKLPYLEYVELQEELCKLKEFKNDIEKTITSSKHMEND